MYFKIQTPKTKEECEKIIAEHNETVRKWNSKLYEGFSKKGGFVKNRAAGSLAFIFQKGLNFDLTIMLPEFERLSNIDTAWLVDWSKLYLCDPIIIVKIDDAYIKTMEMGFHVTKKDSVRRGLEKDFKGKILEEMKDVAFESKIIA